MTVKQFKHKNVTVVPNFQGYRLRKWGHDKLPVITACFATLACWLARLAPSFTLHHFFNPCSLTEAQYVQITLDSKEKLLRKVVRSATAAFTSTTGRHAIHRTDPILFMLGGQFMLYSIHERAFVRVPGVPDDLPEQLDQALACLADVDKGGSWVHLNAADAWSRRRRVLLYGHNDNSITIPNLLGLFFADLWQPALVVQAVKFPPWMYLFSYYVYPTSLLVVILAGQGMCAYLAHQKALRLARLTTQTRLVPYVSKGYVRAMIARHLVPGDIIVLAPGLAVCDMVLLCGNCLVEESVLSGEVLQTHKAPVARSTLVVNPYHPDTHGSCTVLAGSKVIEVWNDQDENDETLAMVVRTGTHTAVGSMLQSHSCETRTLADHLMFKDIVKFGCLMTSFQSVLFLAVLPTLIKYSLGARFYCSQLLLIVLNSVPPLLPTASAMLGARTILRLRQQSLHVADPQKLLAAAQIDMLLFDKTGTLTTGQGSLLGLVEWAGGQISALRQEPITWSNETRTLLALCNDLTPLSRNKVTGPEDEVKLFKKLEAAFVTRNTVCLPQRLSQQSTSPSLAKMEILMRLEYNANVMMSGVIARAERARLDSAQVLLKGAPFEIAALVGFAALPQGWGAAMAHWTGLGYRVLGLAAGNLLPAVAADRQQLAGISLLTLKQNVSDLRMLGLAIITTQLRPDVERTIKQLHTRAGVQPIMVTGDHYLTATAVAKATRLITTKQHVIVGKMPTKPLSSAQPPSTALSTSPGAATHPSVILSQIQDRHHVSWDVTDGQRKHVQLPTAAAQTGSPAASGMTRNVIQGSAAVPLRASPMARAAALARSHNQPPAALLPQKTPPATQPVLGTPTILSHIAAAHSSDPALAQAAVQDKMKATDPGVSPTVNNAGTEAPHMLVAKLAMPLATQSPTHKALDVFGNVMPGMAVQTSRQVVEAGANGTVAAGAITDLSRTLSKGTAAIKAALASLDMASGVPADRPQLNVHQAHLAHATAIVSPAESPQHVLLSAAVQKSTLYAQLTCSIATSEDVQLATAAQAFRAAAEGMQCIMTGTVFDFLLEHAEPAVLEAMLRSTVVYARMKSHQKAQLVSLLGSAGLTTAAGRELKGLGHTIGYAGDGINDVEALRTADVGISIGTGAVIAASIYTPAHSLYVMCSLLTDTRCSIMVSYTLSKYLVLYGFIRMLTNTVTVIIAQREVSNVEYELMDFCIMVMCIAFILAVPSHQLHPDARPRKLLTAPVLAPLGLYALLYSIEQGVGQVLVKRVTAHQPELQKDLAASTAALIGVAQLLVPAISFFKDMWPHTAAFDRNLLVIAVYTVCSALVVVWTLVPSLFSITHGAAWHFVPFIFRIHILVLIMATNFSAIVLSNARRCLQSRLRGTASGSVVPVNA